MPTQDTVRLQRLFNQWAEIREAVRLALDSFLRLTDAADHVMAEIEREVRKGEDEAGPGAT